jgi:hypothetical protein
MTPSGTSCAQVGPPTTAYHLAQNAVIGLDPPEYFGVTIWPVDGLR